MEENTDVIQGTLDLLILKTLSLGALHGFGVARRIEQITRDVFKVNAGSLLTAFQRMERAGLIDSEWREADRGRQGKCSALTRAGGKPLDAERASWGRRAGAGYRLPDAAGWGRP